MSSVPQCVRLSKGGRGKVQGWEGNKTGRGCAGRAASDRWEGGESGKETCTGTNKTQSQKTTQYQVKPICSQASVPLLQSRNSGEIATTIKKGFVFSLSLYQVAKIGQRDLPVLTGRNFYWWFKKLRPNLILRKIFLLPPNKSLMIIGWIQRVNENSVFIDIRIYICTDVRRNYLQTIPWFSLVGDSDFFLFFLPFLEGYYFLFLFLFFIEQYHFNQGKSY